MNNHHRTCNSGAHRGLSARPLGHSAIVAACAMLSCLAGCNVGPDYHAPPVRVPAEFKSAVTPTAPVSRLGADWWKLFGDDGLTRLEESALAASPTLQAAAARVVEARAVARSVKSQFYPVITADPQATRSRSSGNLGRPAVTGNNFSIPFDLTYELDVWGRVRRSYENSQATAQAALDNYSVVVLTLTADVAQDYYQLRGLEAQEAILEESVKLYRDQLNLIDRQLKAGIASTLDLEQTQTLLSSALASKTDITRQRDDMEHAIAILTGRPPTDLSIARNPLLGAPPAVPPGLPADLLRRRPDVAAAEQNMVAANAAVGVAKANFYPVFQLTGAAGFESIDVQHLVDWESRFWSLGPSVSIPIFEGGKLDANLAQAKATFDEMNATYRGTVLTAIQDVEDSLNDLHMRAIASGQLKDTVDHAQKSLDLSVKLRNVGVDSSLQVIDADRTLLDNQLALVQTDTLRYVSTVLLIKAMGGGWEDAAGASATRPATLPADPILLSATQPAK